MNRVTLFFCMCNLPSLKIEYMPVSVIHFSEACFINFQFGLHTNSGN